jgi:hypothetical protein
MKKIFLVIFALIVTAACATPPPESRTPANSNATTPGIPAMTEADAIAKEKAIWDAIKAKDYDAFGNMLAPDQVEVTGEGVLDKAASIAGAKDFEPAEVTFSDWKFSSIDKDAFIVTYSASVKGKFKGKEFPTQLSRCSSAWVNHGGKWLATYHQESPLKPPMPAPAASKSPAPAESSPAGATPVAATGPDPIANEKIVWDLFKAKNYDGFATLLAPTFIEVESDGVYDKTGAVKGVTGFDATKFVLSDWKAVKLNDDAMLVTYTLKSGTLGDGERASSIWAKQDGKWLGMLHHGGTTIVKPVVMAAPKEMPVQQPGTTPAKKP